MKQREIKFRKWHPGYPNEDGKLKLSKIEGQAGVAPYMEYDLDYFENNTDIIFMQYTGLKDKNGKEIYEGDIVHEIRIKTAPMANNGIDRKFEVEDIRELIFNPQDCEVIGNIYENKDLIK